MGDRGKTDPRETPADETTTEGHLLPATAPDDHQARQGNGAGKTEGVAQGGRTVEETDGRETVVAETDQGRDEGEGAHVQGVHANFRFWSQ